MMCDLRFAADTASVHDGVLQARPDRRARHELAAPPPGRHQPGARPAVERPSLRRRGGAAHRLRRPGGARRRSCSTRRPPTCTELPANVSPRSIAIDEGAGVRRLVSSRSPVDAARSSRVIAASLDHPDAQGGRGLVRRAAAPTSQPWTGGRPDDRLRDDPRTRRSTDRSPRLTINRPERMNAMTNRMVRRDRRSPWQVAGDDPSVRVLVLTGAGRVVLPGRRPAGASPPAPAPTSDACGPRTSACRCCCTRCRP